MTEHTLRYEHGPGWNTITDNTIARIRTIHPDATFAQIKEKFGGLRIYLDQQPDDPVVDELVTSIISEAEREASRTCEQCGQPGIIRNTNWYKTLCHLCHTEHGGEIDELEQHTIDTFGNHGSHIAHTTTLRNERQAEDALKHVDRHLHSLHTRPDDENRRRTNVWTTRIDRHLAVLRRTNNPELVTDLENARTQLEQLEQHVTTNLPPTTTREQ